MHVTKGSDPAGLTPDAAPAPSAPRSFQPMNVNFGLFPPIDPPSHDADGRRIKGRDKTFAKKRAMAERALADLAAWINAQALPAAAE